jgi:undecaprenyl-phosphate 4-deoxy-4-formamido-L-arabinose transferase
MSERPITYSIVIPVHNEEGSLKSLFEELLHVMTPLNRPYEIIFINDGSSDRSQEIMEGFKNHFPEVVRVITFSERRGQTYGLRKGLDVG